MPDDAGLGHTMLALGTMLACKSLRSAFWKGLNTCCFLQHLKEYKAGKFTTHMKVMPDKSALVMQVQADAG